MFSQHGSLLEKFLRCDFEVNEMSNCYSTEKLAHVEKGFASDPADPEPLMNTEHTFVGVPDSTPQLFETQVFKGNLEGSIGERVDPLTPINHVPFFCRFQVLCE